MEELPERRWRAREGDRIITLSPLDSDRERGG
jgi:hypothetical protein